MSKTSTTTTKTETPTGIRTGVVESDRMDKTRTVVIRFQAMHPKYKKYINRRTRLHVHDASNESHIGDRVEVAPCRPYSKTKRWTLVRIVEKAPQEA